MIELVLIILCSWRIYTLASQRALTAWKWVVNFLGGYFAFSVLVVAVFSYIYGMDTMKDVKTMQEKLAPWSPFVLLFLVLWFMLLRSRILQYEEFGDDENDNSDNLANTPEPPVIPKVSAKKDDEKDLSYFR